MSGLDEAMARHPAGKKIGQHRADVPVNEEPYPADFTATHLGSHCQHQRFMRMARDTLVAECRAPRMLESMFCGNHQKQKYLGTHPGTH